MRNKWMRWTATLGLIAILTTGCSMGGGQGSEIDPPPNDVWDVMSNNLQFVGLDETVAPVTLFFADPYGRVAPLDMKLPMTSSIGKRSLEYLVDGGPASDVLPIGFKGLLPEGTQILDMNIDEDSKLATVDFSQEFMNYDAKDERKILESITWTLTGFPSVKYVELRVEGKRLQEMPANHIPLTEPLSRTMGINIERLDGINLASAEAITLYFESQSADQYRYMVPVTRMVEAKEDRVQLVLNELIAGPEAEDGIFAVMSPDVEIIDIAETDTIITVNFDEHMLDPEHKVLTDSAKSVILTLTENIAADKKVQIMINGDAEIVNSQDESLTQPVARPTQINPYEI